MTILVEWVGFVAGLLIVWFTLGSMINTMVVPRSVSSHITSALWKTVRGIFYALARRTHRYETQDGVLALLGPVSLLALLALWLILLLAGFALILLPFLGGDLAQAFRISGSSILTLGLASSREGAATVVTFIAAAAGLVSVALIIGYLPTIYSAYNRRETLVTMLESRAGEPAWGPEILAREAFIGNLDTLPALYRRWEEWAADLAETHTNYPWLMSFRSPHPLRSWVTSLLAVMDSAALYLAFVPSGAPSEARSCLRMGFVALRALADTVGFPYNRDPLPSDPIVLSYDEFVAGADRMRLAGFPMERSLEEAWVHFVGWRVNYESIAYFLADFVSVVPALWSGPRTTIDATPIPPFRPAQRTPDYPEGITKPEKIAKRRIGG